MKKIIKTENAPAAIVPGISALSDGTRTILLTVLISSAAAVLFPVKDQEAEHDA